MKPPNSEVVPVGPGPLFRRLSSRQRYEAQKHLDADIETSTEPEIQLFLQSFWEEKSLVAEFSIERLVATFLRIAESCEARHDYSNAVRALNEAAKFAGLTPEKAAEAHRNHDGAIINIVTNPITTKPKLSAETRAILERNGFNPDE